MTYQPKIKKALVVLSPDLVRPDKPLDSTLIRRALALAKVTGCELELFHVCFDASLEDGLLASSSDLEYERYQRVDKDAIQLAEMATRLKNEYSKVKHEVRWDAPRTDAILRKIAQARPDIVLKQGREHSYLLGVTSNTDWELARRSPAHVWFVNDEVDGIERVIAAVGNRFGNPADITTAEDYDLLRLAGMLCDTFKAAVYPVNAFQVPRPNALQAGVAGATAPVEVPHIDKQARKEVVSAHKGAIKAIAQFFNIKTDKVTIREGKAHDVIVDVADSIDADMIVMGAKSIGRLERLVSPVTVEPVMSMTNCDIIVVRDRDAERVPDAEKTPMYGIAQYDLSRAITNPEETFDSPQQLANLADLSLQLRHRILQAWEYDIRAELDEEDEGGPPGDIDYKALDEILTAKAQLKMIEEKSGGNAATTLNGTAA